MRKTQLRNILTKSVAFISALAIMVTAMPTTEAKAERTWLKNNDIVFETYNEARADAVKRAKENNAAFSTVEFYKANVPYELNTLNIRQSDVNSSLNEQLKKNKITVDGTCGAVALASMVEYLHRKGIIKLGTKLPTYYSGADKKKLAVDIGKVAATNDLMMPYWQTLAIDFKGVKLDGFFPKIDIQKRCDYQGINPVNMTDIIRKFYKGNGVSTPKMYTWRTPIVGGSKPLGELRNKVTANLKAGKPVVCGFYNHSLVDIFLHYMCVFGEYDVTVKVTNIFGKEHYETYNYYLVNDGWQNAGWATDSTSLKSPERKQYVFRDYMFSVTYTDR